MYMQQTPGKSATNKTAKFVLMEDGLAGEKVNRAQKAENFMTIQKNIVVGWIKGIVFFPRKSLYPTHLLDLRELCIFFSPKKSSCFFFRGKL